ncbi:hypothetical protein FZC84_04645 [Rossellomorea vietnamensis]|uniref:Uncharacterized protein n=1 Tax=Rossellomorea vietnamensis TaxID=218284 RepID=A0A5D4MIH6_9BACI|nr:MULTISPECIES: hypothetical protein [Bacillaceae]TYS00786.1 hypothetical protein FZC84_04645 [Rossellomorea vietnamensis]
MTKLTADAVSFLIFRIYFSVSGDSIEGLCQKDDPEFLREWQQKGKINRKDEVDRNGSAVHQHKNTQR